MSRLNKHKRHAPKPGSAAYMARMVRAWRKAFKQAGWTK